MTNEFVTMTIDRFQDLILAEEKAKKLDRITEVVNDRLLYNARYFGEPCLVSSIWQIVEILGLGYTKEVRDAILEYHKKEEEEKNE